MFNFVFNSLFSISEVALFGFPNVGKSSLVGALSSHQPEVADYPFTTKAVSVGHMRVALASRQGDSNSTGKQWWTAEDAGGEGFGTIMLQVVDTPGLLFRDDSARKTMEHLSISVLKYTHAVLLLFSYVK